MHDVSTAGSSVWDPSSPKSTGAGSNASLADDFLPPFATLTTDEDREKKAEARSPGTFHVVVNPESFAHLPEYSDEIADSPTLLSARRGSLAYSITSSAGRDSPQESVVVPTDDPNTVIVAKFEDISRRPPAVSKDSGLSQSSVMIRPQSTLASESSSSLTDNFPVPPMGRLTPSEPDTALLDYFRRQIWPQLAQFETHTGGVDRPAYPGADIIENFAAVFPPCYHALMAVAAACLAHQKGVQRVDALQHYQKVLPALQSTIRNPEDVYSDGTFLTHFLLLVYEIVSAEPGGTNLWSYHLNQLLRITMMRYAAHGTERYHFVTWWICHIDLHALLSGAGPGDFIGALLKNDMLPLPSYHLNPLGTDGTSVIYGEERDTMPLLLQLNYEIMILAGKLGLLAREFREETSNVTFANTLANTPQAINTIRETRIHEIQEALRQLWTSSNMMHIQRSMDILPPRSKRLLEHASALYRACIIYSHTSMWPSQALEVSSLEYHTEISLSVQEILQVAEGIVKEGRLELRFIIFPLFMAGIAAPSGAEKVMALNLLTTMERESIGTNTTATRRLLQMVYDRQNERFMSMGHSLDVNWMDIMMQNGLQLFNFGL